MYKISLLSKADLIESYDIEKISIPNHGLLKILCRLMKLAIKV